MWPHPSFPLACLSSSARSRNCQSLDQFDKCGRSARPPSHSAWPRNCLNLNLCNRPTKSVHPTYKSCPSDLQKLCSCASDLQKLYIPPTKSVHLTYESCASDLYVIFILITIFGSKHRRSINNCHNI